MKTLLLVRHAKSDWTAGLPDEERPLNKRGRKDAPMMGKILKKAGFLPQILLTSPAVRARSTAEAVAAELEVADLLSNRKELYLAAAETIAELVRGLPDEADTVVLFGHNPGMEDAAHLFTSAHVAMPTCAMLCIDFPSPTWADARTGNIRWLLLPKLFGKN